MKFLLSMTLLLSCFYGVQCFGVQPTKAQSAERANGCRYGMRQICRTDSGGHTYCTLVCR